MQVGRRLLRQCVFVHLASDDAKFALLLEMLHKLYALANLQCCEDNPDGLTYHEILLPGQLLAKFFKEQAEGVLADLAEHVRTPHLHAVFVVRFYFLLFFVVLVVIFCLCFCFFVLFSPACTAPACLRVRACEQLRGSLGHRWTYAGFN